MSHGATLPWLDIWLTASTAWVRELTPSARSTAATWSLTVSTERFSSRAISLFGWPCSSRPSTSVWRGVRPKSASAGAAGKPLSASPERPARAARRHGVAFGAGRRAPRVAHRHRRHVDAARHHHACSASNSVSLLARLGTKPIAPRIDRADHVGGCGRRPRPRRPAAPDSRAQLGQQRRSRRRRRGAGRAGRGRSRRRLRAPRAPRARCRRRRRRRRRPGPGSRSAARQDQRVVVDQQDLHRRTPAQAIAARRCDSATQTGLPSLRAPSSPRRSAARRLRAARRPSSLKRPRSRLPDGTGAGKRTRFRP